MEQVPLGPFEGVHRSGVCVARNGLDFRREQLCLLRRRKCRKEIVEVKRWPRIPVSHQESMLEFAMERGPEGARLDGSAHQAPQSLGRNRAVHIVYARVEQSPRVTRVSAEGLVAALSRQNDGDLLARQAGHEIERYA